MLGLLAAAPVGAGAKRNRRQVQAPGAAQKPREKPVQIQEQPAQVREKTPRAIPVAPGEYAGSEACGLCHEQARAAAFPYHLQLETNLRFGWTGRGCEACHGPGKAHAESGGNEPVLSFKTATAARTKQACLTCHAQGLRSSGHAWDAHSRNSVSCVACHSVHKPRAGLLLLEPANALCVGCHTNVRAEFFRPYRHKLQEGAMSCVDCHNPHGSPQQAQVRRTAENQQACLKCHGDKRGPFAFEHAPVRLEGCAACHEPHGSVNPRMLNRPEQRFQCLECHTNSLTTLGASPPAFHDLRSPRFQNCTSCHWKIHGSNINRVFLR